MRTSRSAVVGRQSSRELRVAIVGAGMMARHHAVAATRATPDVSIVAVAEPEPEACQAFCQRFGVRGFASLGELLGAERVDVVHVCTPPISHEPLAREALSAGCHVYVEKPFAETRHTAKAILDLARERGLRVCAGHQLLFEPPARRVLALLPTLGRLRHVESYFAFRPVRSQTPGRTPVSADAQLLDVLPHPVYSLLHVLECAVPGVETALSTLEFGPGGTLHALLRRGELTACLTLTLEGRPVESSLHVVGDHGTVHADFVRGTVQHMIGPGVSFADKSLQPYRQARQLLTGTTWSLAGRLLRRQASYPGLTEILQAFYTAIRDQGPDPVSAENLLDTAAVYEAVAAGLRSAVPPERTVGPPPRVLVTGGTGFLGQELVRQLARSGGVRVLSRRGPAPWERIPHVEYRTADLADEIPPDVLEGIETVVHLAAGTSGGMEAHRRNSLEATERLCRAAAAAGVRALVHVSSLAVHAVEPGGTPLREDSPLDPHPETRGAYVWGKLEAERAVRRLGAELALDVKIVRPGPIVDLAAFDPPGRLGRRVGNLFVAVGSKSEPLAIVDRAFAAQTLAWMAHHPAAAPDVLNLLSPDSPTRGELVSLLRARNPALRVLWLPRPALGALSRLAIALQRLARRGRPPVDLAAAFAAERYDTSAVKRLRAGIASEKPVSEGSANAIAPEVDRRQVSTH